MSSASELRHIATGVGLSKDRKALEQAAWDYAVSLPLPTDPLIVMPYDWDYIAARMLGDRLSCYGSFARCFVDRREDGRERLVADTDPTELHYLHWRMIAALRLLSAELRPLPKMKGTTSALGNRRFEYRRFVRLFQALSDRDPEQLGKAIGAVAKAEEKANDRPFSLLAYVLYRDAGQLGIAVKKPARYDF